MAGAGSAQDPGPRLGVGTVLVGVVAQTASMLRTCRKTGT